jgi:hypothetical protein
VRRFEVGSGRAIGNEPLAQLSDALFAMPLHSIAPALRAGRPRR